MSRGSVEGCDAERGSWGGDMSGWDGTGEEKEPLKLLRSSFSAFSKLDGGSDVASPLRSRDSIVAVVVVVGDEPEKNARAGLVHDLRKFQSFVRFPVMETNKCASSARLALRLVMDAFQPCGRASPLDLSDPCVRASWAALAPAVFVAGLCLFSLPLPLPAFARKLGRALRSPLDEFITLREAEAVDAGEPGPADADAASSAVPLWRTVALAFVALVQALVWLSAGAYILVTREIDTWTGVCAVLVGSTWVYGVSKPVFWPKPTAHLDLFFLYLAHLVFGVILLGGVIYDHRVFHLQLAPRIELVGLVFNLIAVLVELALVSTMPMGLPSSRINKEDIVSATRPPSHVPLTRIYAPSPSSIPQKTMLPSSSGSPSAGFTRSSGVVPTPP